MHTHTKTSETFKNSHIMYNDTVKNKHTCVSAHEHTCIYAKINKHTMSYALRENTTHEHKKKHIRTHTQTRTDREHDENAMSGGIFSCDQYYVNR